MSNLSIKGIVDLVRKEIREISDDSVFSDKYIFRLILQSRSELISQMDSNNKSFTPWLYQRFCLKLCPSNFIECGCNSFDFGDVVYRSVNPVPQSIWSENGLIMNVSELWGDNINQVSERTFRYAKYRKNKNKYYYYIGDFNNDKYLFIMSEDNLLIPPKYIKIEGIFEDPSKVLDFACNDGECPKLSGTGFPFTLTKEAALVQKTIQRLLTSKRLPEDLSNNTNSTPNELII